ncbi:MAG: Trm112 family protein [Deltaproteobacteria bacterium]|nr:Trm112 family protein [Deltaproteobacteria bacterium]
MNIDKELMEILACPKCKGGISLDRGGAWIVCENCMVKYPVRDEIPVMLIDEAKPFDTTN